MSNDTICALATPTGGALSIIRLSGPEAIAIVGALCPKAKDNRERNLFHTHITDNKGEVIDDVVVSIFHAPHSYTGEDCVEISCHGSQYIANKILELLIKQGCRMATPGEYTKRAFLNGKLDLSQAEAVADLIASTNKATHQIATSQLRGHFSSKLTQLREQLLHLTTLLELELDFADHEDLEFANRTELLTLAQTIDSHIAVLIQSFETGQAIKQGIPVAIVGKTNVGKSTLLNRLLKDDRAIVSDIHGTTRDTIEDVIDINGIKFRFIDTAGLRKTKDTIEQIGIERTYQAIEKARIVLWLIDEEPSPSEVADMKQRTSGKSLIIVRNKMDIQPVSGENIATINISAKNDDNISALETIIYRTANIPELNDTDVIISNARHYEALSKAHNNLSRVIDGIQAELSGELIAEDLRLVLNNLAEITGGAITSQETLNNVFSHFCVGK